MENLRNRIRCKTRKQQKWLFEMSTKTELYTAQNIWQHFSCDTKVHTSVHTLELCIYEFHYDCIKNKYDNKSKLLISDTDSLMYEIKIEGVDEDFSSNKEMFVFSIIWLSQNIMKIQTNWFLEKCKMKPEVLRLKKLLYWKMYSFFVDGGSEYIKAKNVGTTISHKCPRSAHNRLCNPTSLRPNTQQFWVKNTFFQEFLLTCPKH